MPKIMHAVALSVIVIMPMVAWADAPTCTVSAADRKLAGAAKASFIPSVIENDRWY